MKIFVAEISGPDITAIFDLDTFIGEYVICDKPTKICQPPEHICNGKYIINVWQTQADLWKFLILRFSHSSHNFPEIPIC